MLYRSQLDWIILHILSAEKRVGIDDRMVEFAGKFGGPKSVGCVAKIKGEKVGFLQS